MLDSSIEGFVPFRTLSDHYYFDEQRYRAVGARGGAVINIGQRMGVVVDNVDTELNRIDFRFEDEFEHTPARKGFSSSYKSDRPSRSGRKKSDYRPSKGRTGGKPKSFGGRTGRGGKKGRR
jgi:ribonuclease R